MQEVKKEKKKKIKRINISRLLLVALTFAFLIYSAITIVTQSIQIVQLKETLDDINEQKASTETKIEELQNVLAYDDEQIKEYMEQKARQDLDYIAQGERVFVNISGG